MADVESKPEVQEQGNAPEETKPVNDSAATATSEKPREENKASENSEKTNGAATKDATPRKYDGDNRRGGRGGNNYRGRGKFFKGNVSRYDQLPETDDPDEIRAQVEFYFSDSNLVQDKFLFSLVNGTKNDAIPIKTIHDFKRMRRFQPYSAVVAALKDSETLKVVNDDNDVQRITPLRDTFGTEYNPGLVEVYSNEAEARTVYVKGFGRESESTQVDIEALFRPYGPINSVRLRRVEPEGIFKGSAFVEFESEELAKQFLELDDKPKWNGEPLSKVMSKKEYCEWKAQEIREGKVRPNEGSGRGFRGRGRGRGGRGGGGGRGNGRDRDRNGRDSNRDRDDWKGRRDDFQKGKRDGPRRNRDDDEKNGDENKAEAKAEAPAATAGAEKNGDDSKKRAREDDGGENGAQEAKKAKAGDDE